MSVYTSVEQHQLEEFLTHYELGNLITYQGINSGIENTNYFVTTSAGKFVLTLFESLGHEELPYFLNLMAYLADHNIPTAHPLSDLTGNYLRQLNGKPAALVQKLAGNTDVKIPTIAQCLELGEFLGNLHFVSPEFTLHRNNERGPHWWKVTAERVLPHMPPYDAKLLRKEMDFQYHYQHISLPKGVIHADLFRDNALFDGDKLCGVIDFYYACNDVLIYDVAVTVNDWCSLPSGDLDAERVQAFFDSYNKVRPLTKVEYKIWPVMLRAAALRFWLSRLQDLHFPRPGEMTHIKDPAVFQNILQAHIKAGEQRITLLYR
ncbi:homoserine kinase [Candidatus Halobeggiatoa sp. HSG11]|nr:homoserine kinase [Candidatus Halobeggiatoa sp. HSG11]